MPRLGPPLLLVIVLAATFTASALHPYGHGLDTLERAECQICLHQSVNKPAAEHQPASPPSPEFRSVGQAHGADTQPFALVLPVARARGPPHSA